MKNFLARLDLTAIAYVAAMAVLLSTMFLLAPFSTFAQSGDGDGDGDGGGGVAPLMNYIEANIKQVEIKPLTSDICRRGQWSPESALLTSNDLSKCVGIVYYIKLDTGLTVSVVRIDSLTLSEFYGQIRNSGFTGEMDMMMEILNRIGKAPGIYTVTHTATGFTINDGVGYDGDIPENYGNEFDKFNEIGNTSGDYSFDIDNLFGYFTSDTATGKYDQSLLKEIIKLLERLEELKKKLEELKKDKVGELPKDYWFSRPWCKAGAWTRDLSLGDEGEDVRTLQRFLNTIPGIKIAASGPGSPGNESTFFGHATEQALIKFQEMHTVSLLEPIDEDSGTGYFGAITQAFIAKQYCKEVVDTVTSFRLSDVEHVFVQAHSANDIEYLTYTIELESGKVITVKIRETLSDREVEKAFRDVGYTGDVDDLIDMAEAIDGQPYFPNFDLDDVEEVTKRDVDPIANAVDDEYTLFTITLESGRVVTVRVYGNALESMTVQAFRDVGYTGDIDDLMDMAEEEEVETFRLRDIESVTREYVDPSEMMADEEYSIYTITLKNDRVIVFIVASFTIAGAFEAELREAGYIGDVDDFTDIVETVESENDFGLGVHAVKLKAYATFDLPNGCTGYVIDWGDGEKDTKVNNNTDVCTQVYGSVTVEHTYDEADTYEVEVTLTTGTQKKVAKRSITVME